MMINTGDTVTAYWVTDDEQLKGMVMWTPRDVGDMWYIKAESGNIHAINPSCSDFIGIIKEAPDAEAT